MAAASRCSEEIEELKGKIAELEEDITALKTRIKLLEAQGDDLAGQAKVEVLEKRLDLVRGVQMELLKEKNLLLQAQQKYQQQQQQQQQQSHSASYGPSSASFPATVAAPASSSSFTAARSSPVTAASANPPDIVALFHQLQLSVTEQIVAQVTHDMTKNAENLLQRVTDLLPKAESHTHRTPAHLALDTEEALARQHASVQFTDRVGDPAVLSHAQQVSVDAASACSEESMVAHLTAYLWPWIIGEGSAYRSLVNSETTAWLQVKAKTSKLNLKPDLWVGPSYIVHEGAGPSEPDAAEAEPDRHQQRKAAAAAARAEFRRAPLTPDFRYIFGTPQGTGWYDSISPLAAKCSLTHVAFGEEIAYLQHLSRYGVDQMSRGMLFGPRGFYLLTCHAGAITRRVVAQWEQAGTGPLIRDFFSVESPWEAAIRAVCSELRLQPIRQLGIGGTARVIEVKQQSDGERWALKVVLPPMISSLTIEQDYLHDLIDRAHKQRDSDPVLSSILPSNISPLHKVWGDNEQPLAAAFLLQPVGEPLLTEDVLKQPSVFCEILQHLRALHQCGVCHGDPRVPNLLRRAVPSVSRRDTRAAAAAATAAARVAAAAAATTVTAIAGIAAIAASATASTSSSSSTSSDLAALTDMRYFWVDFMQRDPAALRMCGGSSSFIAPSAAPSSPSLASSFATTAAALPSSSSSSAVASASAMSVIDRRYQIHQDVHYFLDSFTGRQHQRGPVLAQLLAQYDEQLHAPLSLAALQPLADKMIAYIKHLRSDVELQQAVPEVTLPGPQERGQICAVPRVPGQHA